ncbi:SUR7/PalI family-domain-containing protein [Mrakia frigida]|uniref:SUR7/PalI family-domain-containing protein n=1 Tax=Mrakia frigida TaxID=29902 RepID=UPI003FCC02EE
MKPATPGTILTAASTVLLALASFSTPLLKSLYFFKASFSSSSISGVLTLGTLGFCLVQDGTTTCSSPSVGYDLDLNAILGVTIIDIPEVAAKWITYVLVLHIVALGLSAGAFVLGLLAHCREFAMGCFSSCFASMAAAVALIAFIFDIVLFLLARTRINSLDGASSSIGPAVWIVLAAWVLLFLSGCAFGCGRRCISSRGPRNERGERGERVPYDTAYAEEARIEAIRAEEERKARQASGGGSHLPGFQPYETQPLTGGNKQPDQWLDEEEDPALAGGQAYRDQPGQGGGYGRQGSSDGGHGYGRGAYSAGGGSAVGMGRRPSDSYRPEAQRTPSDQYYAGGQSTPGGYPPISNDHSNYYQDPQTDYQQNSYPPQPQDPYYNPQLQPQSPPQQQQPYIDPYASSNAYASSPNAALAGAAWNQHQQQPYISPTSPQQRYASPSNNQNAYSPDPRSAMQHNFASPPPPPPSQINDAYATDAYGGYAANPGPSPASPANVYAPSPQRLAQQHPASLTPGLGGHGDPSGGSGSVYYDASSSSQGGGGGGGVASGSSGGGGGVVEPPSYELSSMAPGQTDVRGAGGSGSGFPREKGGYQPGAGR